MYKVYELIGCTNYWKILFFDICSLQSCPARRIVADSDNHTPVITTESKEYFRKLIILADSLVICTNDDR